MNDFINKHHFQELAKKDPIDVCRRAICSFDFEKQFFKLTVWGDEYRIFPMCNKIECTTTVICQPHNYFFLFIIHYLLYSKTIEAVYEWISEKDIAGGTTFFRGPHEIPTRKISDRFRNKVEEFEKVCEQLNGIPIKMADKAYVFEITPRIPVAVLYWYGDSDFPAESKILFDRTITEHLATNIIYALSVGICHRLTCYQYG
jgi:hypothetical protein